MGPRLGIFHHNFQEYPSRRFDYDEKAEVYPSKPMLNAREWQNIIDYYIATSPDTLVAAKRQRAIKTDLSLFSASDIITSFGVPAISYVKMMNTSAGPYLVIGEAMKETLYLFDNRMKILDSVKTSGAVVEIDFQGDSLLICNMGIVNPNTGKWGKAEWIKKDKSGSWENTSRVLFENLERPVQISATDLNNDGKNDYLVCEFGYITGAFSWMENLGNNQYKKNILRPFPGALKAYMNDYNKDGFQDIWVLFSQGEEGIFLFTNKGKGKFEQKEVVRFPPVYGSSHFELVDFNKDGHNDIIYTCGDNADYSPVLKPYHGVYIFTNDGSNNFKQEYFFPINGCYKALARDFDGDGDLDIATISFFADYTKQPEEGFVYLENEGSYNFQPYSLAAAQVGRWLTMDAGDINNDGKPDLILGNFSVGPSLRKPVIDWKAGPPFMILQNTGKKR
jgi:hypothetical protein